MFHIYAYLRVTTSSILSPTNAFNINRFINNWNYINKAKYKNIIPFKHYIQYLAKIEGTVCISKVECLGHVFLGGGIGATL